MCDLWFSVLVRDDDIKIVEHHPDIDPTYGQASWSLVCSEDTREDAEAILEVRIHVRMPRQYWSLVCSEVM